jgi:hypothetical protein
MRAESSKQGRIGIDTFAFHVNLAHHRFQWTRKGAGVVPGLNLMVVAAGAPIPGKPGNGKLLIFNRTDNGNAKPLRVISLGPKAGYFGDDFVVSPKVYPDPG